MVWSQERAISNAAMATEHVTRWDCELRACEIVTPLGTNPRQPFS